MSNRIRMGFSVLLVLLIITFSLRGVRLIHGLAKCAETAFFVSGTGDDSNPGTIDKPFLTLEGARDVIRRLKDNGGLPEGNVVVYIRGGDYYRDKTFNLDSRDSGTANSPIIYKPFNSEKVTISGGLTLENSKFIKVTSSDILDRIVDETARSHIYECDLRTFNIDLTSSEESIVNAPELFFNNSPLTLARWPNESYAVTGSIVRREVSDYVFQFKEDRPLLWSRLQDAWLFGYWYNDWADDTVRLNSVNSSSRHITIVDELGYGIEEDRRYFAFNLLEELDKPGEWYLDRSNKVIYLYPPSEMDNARITLSQLKYPFVSMDNTCYVTIEGLNFEAGRNTAITINGGENNIIAGCTIRNISKSAVTIKDGSHNGVQSCNIYNTGTGGILITAGDRNTLTAAGNYADNNEVYNYARMKRTYSPAIGLNGVGNRASHNVIHDAPHLAVFFSGNDHIMEYNEIYSVVRETDDAGAIYTYRDWTFRGNVLRYNYIHDIGGEFRKYGKSGIYLDDCMSSAEVYGNVFNNVHRAMLLGGGRDLVVRDNLIVNCRVSIEFDERGLMYKPELLRQLHANLARVPYQSDIWRKKYPKLDAMAKDSSPGTPSGNTVINNALFNSKAPSIAPSVIKYGTVSENNPLSKIDYLTMRLYILTKGRLKIKQPIKDFKLVPLHDIGNYKDKYRQ